MHASFLKRGGILLAWKGRELSLTEQEFSTNTITAKVSSPGGSPTFTPWWITVVYGP